MITLPGLLLGQGIDIEFTGLRPIEKMFEELLYAEKRGERSAKCPKIFLGQPLKLDAERLSRSVHNLQQAAQNGDVGTI